MGNPLNVLIVEDSESDAAMMSRLLRKAGYDVHDERVETANEMRAALERQAWDVVIADYRLPQFDAPASLALLQQTGLDIPFIVVSGTVGEDVAVAMMKAGAHDYLMKDKLTRLAPAVEREIREVQTRRERQRAEEALRASEERYRLITEHVNDIVWQLDKDLRFVHVSPAVERILGYSVEETHQLAVVSLLDSDGIALMRQIIQARLTDGQEGPVTPAEYKMRHKDGRLVDVEVVSSAIFDRDGQLVGFAGVTRDITERKRADEALREAETKYRTLVEQIPAVVYMDAIDETSSTIYISPQIEVMLGYTPDEWVSDPELWLKLLHPDDRSRVLAEHVRTNATGEPYKLEYRLIARDGRSVWVHDEAVPIRDRVGTLRFWQGVMLDITERKQAEEALQQSHERFQLVNRATFNAIWDWDLQTDALWWNENFQTLFGYRAAEIEPGIESWMNRIHPQDLDRVKAGIHAAIDSGRQSWSDQYRFRRKNGTYAEVDDRGYIGREASGKPVRMIGAMQDITERKRAEEALWKIGESYRGLFEGVPVGLYRSTSEGQILDANPALIEMLGYPDWKSLMAVNAADLFVSPEDREKQQVLLEREGIMRHFETQMRRRDGTLIWVRDTARAILDTEGRVTHREGSLEDITERKRAEEAIRQHARRLASLNEIGQAITSTLDLDHVLVTLLEGVRQATLATACSAALLDKDTGELVFRKAVGGAERAVTGLRLKPGHGIAGWVVQNRQSVLVPDAASDTRFYGDVDLVIDFSTHDLICVPLIARDSVIGALELINKQHGQFDEDDVRLLESVAAQAAITIENTRLFETERAGRQRLETLYRIGQTINSTMDADTILDRLTDEAMQATRATHGSALVVHSDLSRFERRSLRGYSSEQAERARRIHLPVNHGVNGRAYRTQQAVYLPDTQTDSTYFPLIPETRSELAVPIIRGGQVLGNLDLQSPEVDAFRDVDVGFLQALTDQVAIALENARLFEEAHRRLEEMAVVSNVALVGAAGRPFDETVERATAALGWLWPEATLGFLFVDETGQSLRPHPSYFGPPEALASLHIPLERGIVGRAARERQPVRVGDVTTNPYYFNLVASTRSEMVAPLVVGEGSDVRPTRVIGVVNVESQQLDAFSGDDLRLLAALASQLATIFEKARLDAALEVERASLARRVEQRTAELRVANEELRLAHEQVSRALEKERELGELKSRFISTASHEFRTPLSTILSSSELLEHYGDKWTEDKRLQHLHRIQAAVNNMVQLLEDVLIVGRAEAGRLEFKPAPLDLTQFCHGLVEEMQLATGPHHTIAFSSPGESMDAHVDEKLLRQILSNLLSNAIKYSPQGGAVHLELVRREGEAIFRVRDEGIGIPPEDQARLFESFHRSGNVGNIPGTGLGLTIVKKSVDLQGGTITVDSRVGVGTTFVVTIPLHPAAQEEST